MSEYLSANEEQRLRLKDLAARLSDDELGRELDNGLTVADVLVHLAFWDHYTAARLREWETGGFEPTATAFESVNEAVKALAARLPLRTAVDLVVSGAEAVDRQVELVPAALAGQIVAEGKERSLNRSLHRRMHLDQIEQVLGS